MRRVVLTSSFAAVMNVGGRTPWPMDAHYTEEHWNVSSAPDADGGAFPEPVNAHATQCLHLRDRGEDISAILQEPDISGHQTANPPARLRPV